MKKSTVLVLGTVVVGASVLLAVPSVDARRGADDTNEHAAVSTTGVTITQARAIEIAQSRLAGTVKKAQLELEHGKKTWKVRIFSTDGRRGDFRIDAATGDVLRAKIKATGKVDRSVKLAEKAEKKRLKLEAKQKKFEEKMKRKAAKRAEKEDR